MGVKVTSLDKSVFFRTQQWFGYGYGGGRFRDPDPKNLRNGTLKVNGNFETGEERAALGIISIRVGDLLISGSIEFAWYISCRIKGGIRGDSYGGNKATYLDTGIGKVRDADSEGIILDSGEYEEK